MDQLHIQRGRNIFNGNTYQSMIMLPARAFTYLVGILYKPLLVKYLSKERLYSYGSIRLSIAPEVFHPGFFFSTRLLLKYIQGLCLQNKTLLELGAGSGLISVAAAQAGAVVTSTDINPVAVQSLAFNAKENSVTIEIIESDLFSRIPKQVFDYIIINPPYYFKQPASFKEYAWFCGEDGIYFSQLFAQIGNYISENTVILMVLCESSERQRIQDMAASQGLQFDCVYSKRNLIEKNYIYRIHQIPTDIEHERDTTF